MALLAYLVYVAYPAVPLYGAWTLARRLRQGAAYEPWVARLSARGQHRLRVAVAAGAALAGIGSALLAVSPGVGVGAVASVPVAAAAGSVVYLSGVATWEGRTAYLLRLAGWLAMFATAAVPSQLTLVLPLVASLMVAVHPVADGADRPTPGGQ